jgi:hypothetical protein
VLSNDSVVDIELDAVRDEHPDTVLCFDCEVE